MYTVENLEKMETLESNEVYGELKIDTNKKRVYLDGGIINVETYINGYDKNYWGC